MRGVRVLLASAAVWNLAEGVLLLVLPERQAGVGAVTSARDARAVGGVVAAFGVLYAVLAIRPSRPLLIVSAFAKGLGAVAGLSQVARGKRDAVTIVSLGDAPWVPAFFAAARRIHSR